MSVYEFKSRIRYSEIGPDGYLSPVAMLDYLQDASTFHSEDFGVGPGKLMDIGAAWVLNSWQVCIVRMPAFGEEVTVQTWSYDIKGMLGFRNFRMLDGEGHDLVKANSVWVYVDLKSMMPVKFPMEMAKVYGQHPKLDMEYAPRKVALPDDMEPEEPFEVKSYYIDTNHHMNNAKYVLAAMDYLPEGFEIHEIRAEYKKSAYLNDMISPKVDRKNGHIVTVALEDSEGNIYATVQFL